MTEAAKVTQELICKIQRLKKDIESKDEDIRIAAGLGTQLLQEKQLLAEQLEILKQEKHSLQLNLDTKTKYVENQATEIEMQRITCDNLATDISHLKKELFQINKKYQGTLQENVELKKHIEDFTLKNDVNKQRISSLQAELEDAKSNLDVSRNEINSDEYFKAIHDLQECKNEKESLIVLTSTLQRELEEKRINEEKLTEFIREYQKELRDKNDELQSYINMAEKEKEESLELKAEIEQLKYEQTDVNRRGNSVFAEVEDGKRALERNYNIMKKRYTVLKESYQSKQDALLNAKSRISSMMILASKKVDMKYVEDMEKSLHSARQEIEKLCNQLVQRTEVLKGIDSKQAMEVLNSDSEYNYLRVMYQQSQKKVEELKKEIHSQRLQYLAEVDRTMIVQRKLRESGMMTDKLKSEVYKLNLRLEEVAQEKINDNPLEAKVQRAKVKEILNTGFRKEIIPGCENHVKFESKPQIQKTTQEPVIVDLGAFSTKKREPFRNAENEFQTAKTQLLMNPIPRTRKNALRMN